MQKLAAEGQQPTQTVYQTELDKLRKQIYAVLNLSLIHISTERAVVQYTHDCELCILQLNGITHGQGVAFVEYRQHRVCAILRLCLLYTSRCV